MSDEKRYAIAETFMSLQGEGYYAGVPMFFIRFAGCNVGRPFPGKYTPGTTGKKWIPVSALTARPPDVPDSAASMLVPDYAEMCTTWDGRTFLCDTNYKPAEKLTAEELVARIPADVRRICLTGGEPFLQDVDALVSAFETKMREHRQLPWCVHCETSGTRPVPNAVQILDPANRWIAVSPKREFRLLDYFVYGWANEAKFLVDASFVSSSIEEWLGPAPERILCYLQPVNDVNDIRNDNLQRCLQLLERYPGWRLSLQLHKVIGVR